MRRWGKNFKQRGEWVELVFMAAAASRGYHVLKPWGDSRAYDVGIDQGAHFLRVQVKCTGYRRHSGYYCQLQGGGCTTGYDLGRVDLFALYIVPTNVWYLVPASVILIPRPKTAIVLCPETRPKCNRYKYELFREAWGLLAKNRRDLARSGKHG
jgi:PD-(D/E)XK nuclease superfamily protein